MCDASLEINIKKDWTGMSQSSSLTFEWFFFLIHIHCCRCLVCRRFMVRGLGEHLIMHLTWVPWIVAMVIAKGAIVL